MPRITEEMLEESKRTVAKECLYINVLRNYMLSGGNKSPDEVRDAVMNRLTDGNIYRLLESKNIVKKLDKFIDYYNNH